MNLVERKFYKQFRFSSLVLVAWMVILGCGNNTSSSISGTGQEATNGVDSDQDGVSDAEEIAAGMDPKNADSDGDGWLDGEDADSPRLSTDLQRRITSIGQMFALMFPSQDGEASILAKNGLSSVKSSQLDAVYTPLGTRLNARHIASETPKNSILTLSGRNVNALGTDDDCGGYSEIKPYKEPDQQPAINAYNNVFMQIKTNAESGEGTLTLRVLGVPICKNNNQPDRNAPLSWQYAAESIGIKYERAQYLISTIFPFLDQSFYSSFKIGDATIVNRGFIYLYGEAENKKEHIKKVKITIQDALGAVMVDPKFFGLNVNWGLDAVLFGQREGCNPGEKSYANMAYQAYDHGSNKVNVMVFEPRYPTSSQGPACTPFFESKGFSYGWKMKSLHFESEEVGLPPNFNDPILERSEVETGFIFDEPT